MGIQYPCSICAKDCVSDTIWCSSCKHWVHRTCCDLTKVDFHSWSVQCLKFACTKCAFSNGHYNYSAALARLKHALDSKSMKLLSSQAKSEQKLLDTYHANLPQQRPLNADTAFAFEESHVDNNSISVLKLFCPALCETLVPLRTVGDGNCLYRAVSLACFSHEGHHVLLRLLVAIEIALNRTFYNKDKTKHKMLYIRVPAHVLDEVKELSSSKVKPSKIMQVIKQKYEPLECPSSLNSIRQTIHRQKNKDQNTAGHSSNIADQIQSLENMVSEGHSFVRSIIRNSGKPPCIILYTDAQMSDIKNLCCSGQSVLGIDKTFMLCKMHVTVTCYKQLSVVRHTTKEPPIFLGPLFIHDNSDYETYSHFFHHLFLKLSDTDMSKMVIGTDDEKAMVKAIQSNFTQATHVLCTRHIKQNAIHHLTDIAVDVKGRKNILEQIFGEDGIASADDTICFEEKCTNFEEACSEVSSKFLDYFKKRLKSNLKYKVNVPSRKGLVDSNWTNNNCESINHVLKQSVEWKTLGLTSFVETAQSLVEGQLSELRAALIGTGEFRLADSHSQFQTSKSQWLSMTPSQRQNLFKRFRQFKVNCSKLVKSSDGKSTVVAPRTNGKKPGARKRKVNIKTTSLPKKAKI